MTISRRLVRSLLRRAHREDGGQVLIFFAMFIVSVGLAMGVVAVDASFWHSERRRVQAAADAAALAAAQDIPSNDYGTIKGTAESYARYDGYENGNGGVTVEVNWPPLNGPHATSADKMGYVEVIIHSPTSGFFIGAFKGLAAPNHGARAEAGWDIAVAGSSRAAACGVYALDPHNIETVFVRGAGSLNVTNACLQVNSDDRNEAAEIEGSGNVMTNAGAGGAMVVGTLGNGSPSCKTPQSGRFIPPCSHGALVADPLRGAPAPSGVSLPVGLPVGCSGAPPVCNLTGAQSLNAGVYGTINAQTGSTVTLNPGIYVITGSFGGAGSIDASGGVLLYFGCTKGSAPYWRTCNSGDTANVMGALTLSNNGHLTINAPTKANCSASTTCDYLGMALFYDQLNKDDIKLQDDSTLDVTGTIYAPAATLRDDSSADSSARSLIILDELKLTDSGNLAITYDPKENYSLPGAVLTE